MSVRKIRCEFHQDDTASLALYGDKYYCFGCGARGETKNLKGAEYEPQSTQPRYSENMRLSVERIRALPVKSWRGLDLHCDSSGAYILWPDLSYYKYRLFDPDDGKSKYRSPVGHSYRPLVLAQGFGTVVVVEGEINALTLSQYGGIREGIVCPGAASNFNAEFTRKWLPHFPHTKRFIICCDSDKAGIAGAIQLKVCLLEQTHDVTVLPMTKDFNEIYKEEGQEGVRKYVEAYLGLPTRVRP